MADETKVPDSKEPAAPAPDATTSSPPPPQNAAPKDPPAPAAGDVKQDGQAAAPKGDGFLAGAAKQDEPKKDGKDEKASGDKKPEPYELALPEGVPVEPSLLKGFTAKAVELGITKEHAQALVDSYMASYLELTKTAETDAAKRAVENRKALEANPEVGGQKLQQSQVEARRAIVDLDRRFSGLGSRIAEKLAKAGFGDDPDIAHFFVHYGRGIKEDRSAGGAPATGNTNVTKEEIRLAKRFPSIKGIQVPGT